MIYNVIDLFAGAGGLSLGFKQTGQVNIIAAAENNPNAMRTAPITIRYLSLFLIPKKRAIKPITNKQILIISSSPIAER